MSSVQAGALAPPLLLSLFQRIHYSQQEHRLSLPFVGDFVRRSAFVDARMRVHSAHVPYSTLEKVEFVESDCDSLTL